MRGTSAIGYRILACFIIGLLLLGYLPAPANAGTIIVDHTALHTPASWLTSTPFIAYTDAKGNIITDQNGEIHPSYADVTSGPTIRGTKPAHGSQPSVYMKSDGTNMFFRMRIGENPVKKSKFSNTNYMITIGTLTVNHNHWESALAIGFNGNAKGSYVYLTKDGNSITKVYNVTATGSVTDANQGVEVVPISDGTGQCFLDFQVPISEIEKFTDTNGNQFQGTTPIRLFYATSQAENLAVINKDYVGTSDYSSGGTITLAAPAAPTGLAVSAITQTSATLTWTATTGATSYHVYKDGSLYASPITNTAPITGLTASTTYSLTVSAVNAVGEGAQSTALPVTTLPAVPPALTLKVLEVQPGTTYDLTTSLLAGTFPNSTINITQMSMAEFISKVDEINGQYDIVYLGNNTSGGSYTALGTAPTNLPQGGSNNGSGTSKEYYCDNDITNRRANILKDFINSKQLTIFENSILSNNSSIQSTKLYTNFISYKSNSTYPNFTIVDTSSSKTTNLINAFSVYNTGSLAKKPKLKINNPAHDQPMIYDGTDASYQTNKSLGFKFDINNLSTANNMAAKLYIDNNGDGIFKASDDYAGKSELVYKMDDLNSGAGYTINYRLPDSYIGLQPWKLELTDNSTGAKSYITGATAFKGNSGDEVNLRLLQLEPDGNTFSIYSLSNVNGQNLLYKDKVYRIQVTEMNISDFNAAYTHTTPTAASAKVNGVTTTAPTVLNGNYDMLIMGFADVYGNGDLTNTNAINALKNFIATNQSVMLTHDTLTFQANSPNTWGYNITQNFRNLVGQQRYYHSAPDANRYYNPMPNSGKDSYGFTNLTLGRYNNGVTNNGKTFETTTSTHKINDNLVTQFPFPLGDITVSGTHFQYYQLDLEDQNVVPVYSLTNSGSSSIYNHPGDGRNDYYTYTKGNITFSGTGHSKVNDDNSIDEEKMFLNTIIKASRGANHAPTLDVNGISDGMNIANASQSINFSFTATDIDPGDQYLNANVNLSTSTDGTAFSPYTTIHQFDDQDPDLTQRVKSGVPHATSVSIANSTNITAYKVQVVVTDNQGAIVSKETIINSVNDPQVTPQSPNDLSCLVGDTLSIPVTVVATPTGLNETFKNINLRGIKTNPSGVATQVMSSVATDYPDITFDPAPSSSNQLKAYPVTNNYSVPFNDVGTNEILTQLNYTAYMGTSQTGITRKNEQTFSVQVKSGEIDVHVVALENGIPKGITGIPMVINGPFKDETTNTTDSSGSASYTGLGSGNYTVTLTVPEGYSFDNSANQPVDVNLSANNPEQPITFTLKQQSLLAPTGLAASDITQTSATLTWDTTLGATSYNVYKDGIFYASSETNTAPITGLTANTTYTFTVSAIHAGGESPKSSPASVTTLNEMLISNPKITTRTGANAVSILQKVPIQGTVRVELSREVKYLKMDFSTSTVQIDLSNMSCDNQDGHQLIDFKADTTDPNKLLPIDPNTTFPGGTYSFDALITEADSNIEINLIASAQDTTDYTESITTQTTAGFLTITVGTAPPLH